MCMKIEVLEELLTITNQQETVLIEEDMTKFEKLLDEKQVLLDKLEKIQNANEGQWTKEEQMLIAIIQQTDDKNKEAFYKEYDSIRMNLGRIRNQRKMANFYNNPYNTSREEGMFFDKR